MPAKARREIDLLIDILKLATFLQRPMKERVVDHCDMSVNELRLLMCLAGEGTLAGQEMSELMGISAMNVSRALTMLENKGLIERVDNNDNRRRKPVQLTARGEQEFAALQQPLSDVAALMFKGLNASEQRQLREALSRINHNTEAAV